MIKLLSIVSLIFSISLVAPMPSAQAQSSSDFMLANTFLRQGEFERAYEILERLMRQNPSNYAVYDRAMTALINLRRLDEAIEITQNRLNSRYADFNTSVKLGELFHINRDFEKATETWLKTIEEYGNDLQVYRQVAETMTTRRDFEGAIKVYEKARERFGNPQLFRQESAQTFLSAGMYELGMQEYLRLMQDNRNYQFAVQRQLVRFDEPLLYDTAIMETEDMIAANIGNTELITTYRDFLIWLQTERHFYRRALITARAIERDMPNRFAQFELAGRLQNRQQFALAEEAFQFYINDRNHPSRSQAMHQAGTLYMEWAQYKILNNLDFNNESSELYQKAADLFSDLLEEYPNYSNRADVLMLQIELALDFLKDTQRAKSYFARFEQLAQTQSLTAQRNYLEGRILIHEGQFAMARISLTRAHREARRGTIAERSRYHLALSDFYNEEYEFSRLQLRSLERENSSYMANNALRLRAWIQDGTTPEDSLKRELRIFSEMQFEYARGNYPIALYHASRFLADYSQHPLTGEVLLLSSRIFRKQSPEVAFLLLDKYQSVIGNSPVKERLLWEMANLAAVIVQRDIDLQSFTNSREQLGISDHGESRFYLIGTEDSETIMQRLPSNIQEVVIRYEDVLLEFPQGFYAASSRTKIQELQRQLQRAS